MKRLGFLFIITLLAVGSLLSLEAATILISWGDTTITGTIDDSAAGRDLVSMLPLDSVTLNDYASVEKIFYPPCELSTQGMAPGYDPSIGDIAYYAPWGNIVFYYREAGYASGLIHLGRIEGDGIAALRVPGSIGNVSIRLVDAIPEPATGMLVSAAALTLFPSRRRKNTQL